MVDVRRAGRGRDAGDRPHGVAIPVAVAADEAGWSAVAVTRNAPGAEQRRGRLALVVRTGRRGRRPARGVAVRPRRHPRLGHRRPLRRRHHRLRGGRGAVATWLADGDGWSAGLPDLGLGEVVSARVAGTDTGFVLAAVGRDGSGHLWSSTDGRGWSGLDVSDAGLDGGLAAVGLLTDVGSGDVVAAWLAGDAGAEDVALDADRVLVHRVEDATVRAYGVSRLRPATASSAWT